MQFLIFPMRKLRRYETNLNLETLGDDGEIAQCLLVI